MADNPFYFADPYIGRGISSLASIFAPDPAREARRAQAGLYGAQTETERLRQQEITRRFGAQDRLAAGLREGGGANPQATLGQWLAEAAAGGPDMFNSVRQGAGVLGAVNGLDDRTLGRIFMGNGMAYQNTEEGRRYVTGVESGDRRHAANSSAGATLGAARIGANAQIERERMQQAGLDRRMAPEINPNNVVVVPPTSPLAGRADGEGRIQGNARPQTLDAARAAELPNYLNPPAGEDPGVTQRRRDVIAPSVSAAETRAGGNRQPLDVSPTEAAILTSAAARLLGHQVDQDGRPTGANTLTPLALQWLQRRTGELYQQTRDAGTAAAQAADEFRRAYETGDTRVPQRAGGWFGGSPNEIDLPQMLRSGTAGGSGAGQRPAQAPRAGAQPPAARTDPGSAPPITATNPQTGQRLILQNGQWVPEG